MVTLWTKESHSVPVFLFCFVGHSVSDNLQMIDSLFDSDHLQKEKLQDLKTSQELKFAKLRSRTQVFTHFSGLNVS